MKSALDLGKIFGINVKIHFTFILIFVYFGYNVWTDTHNINEVLYVFLIVLISFLCVLMHEFGHALAARRIGIDTRQIMILPIGGMAQINRMPEKPKDELFVTICGPLVNLGIVLVLIPFAFLNHSVQSLMELMNSNLPEKIIDNFIFHNILLVIILLNTGLFIFNLIPAFPMDGGRIFRAILAYKFRYRNATLVAARTGQIIAGLYFIYFIVGFIQTKYLKSETKSVNNQVSGAPSEKEDINVGKNLNYFDVLRIMVLCGFIGSLAEMEYRMVKYKDKMGAYNLPENLEGSGFLSLDDGIGNAIRKLQNSGRNSLLISQLNTVSCMVSSALPEDLRPYRDMIIANSKTHRFFAADTLGYALNIMEILGVHVLDISNVMDQINEEMPPGTYFLLRNKPIT